MANKPKDFPIFTQVDSATMQHLMDKLPKFLHNIAAVLGIKSSTEIIVDQEILYEIFTRVEKRRVYFHIYHNGLEMGELNEAALIVFWILKLMPFKHDIISSTLLNVKIAYTFLINILYYIAAKKKKGLIFRVSLWTIPYMLFSIGI